MQGLHAKGLGVRFGPLAFRGLGSGLRKGFWASRDSFGGCNLQVLAFQVLARTW